MNGKSCIKNAISKIWYLAAYLFYLPQEATPFSAPLSSLLMPTLLYAACKGNRVSNTGIDELSDKVFLDLQRGGKGQQRLKLFFFQFCWTMWACESHRQTSNMYEETSSEIIILF